MQTALCRLYSLHRGTAQVFKLEAHGLRLCVFIYKQDIPIGLSSSLSPLAAVVIHQQTLSCSRVWISASTSVWKGARS